MKSVYVARLLKLSLVCVLVAGVMLAVLSSESITQAQETEHQTFMVQAGGFGPAQMELLAFAPASLKVHQGDTVMWHINSFHNIRFDNAPVDLIIFPVVDGNPLPQINPAVGFPSIENGAVYQGGVVNSGLPDENTPLTFSLVIDLEPGVYGYVCDVHPGMIGTIEVVADNVAIPSPVEAAGVGADELSAAVGQAMGPVMETMMSAPTTSTDGGVTVTASVTSGRVIALQFFSGTVDIHAGESVTWTNPADSIDPHFVNSVDYDPVAIPDVVPLPQEGGPPILSAGPGFLGTTPSGTEIGAGDSFHSPFLLPGQSYTLVFTEPGVYPYICHIHPGMQGAVVVEPAM
jgi:plastocyanin